MANKRLARKGWLLLCALILCLPASAAQTLRLSIDDIVSPAFHARNISASLAGPELSRFEARIGELALHGKSWRNVRLQCPDVRLEGSEIRCARGMLRAGENWPVSFRYAGADKRLEVALLPSPGEAWRIAAQWGGASWHVQIDIANGKAARLAPWLPGDLPQPAGGTVSGQARLSGAGGKMDQASADLRLDRLAFSDAAGLHAGEKIGGGLKLAASKRDENWRWRMEVDWREGEVFWQPLYFARGGHRLVAEGSYGAGALHVARSGLSLAEVGAAEIAGTWDTAARRLRDFDLRGADLDLAGLYRILLKPFLEQTAFAKVGACGRADLDWRYRSGATAEFDLALHSASFEDEERRFVLRGVNARIPWSSEEERAADIRLESGELLRIPLGAARIPLIMRGWQFSLPELAVPVLDGTLRIEDFQAAKQPDGWQWQFSGGLSPVSMERLSEVLKLPAMHGTLSGVIPRVSHSAQTTEMDGALLIKVFDGTAVIKDLAILDALGRAPRLHANLDMRNLDLDLLTRTFSFGSMQGRIDMRADNLELANWRPVKFDAEIRSSPGDYPRKISQSAVQNISSLGGAGAGAAISRSFLRFFEQFGYDRIGLSCRLRNGVCLMDGIEPGQQGYIIVKGGGIPAISVIGYNRNVSWDELLERLKRITQANVKPIVQ